MGPSSRSHVVVALSLVLLAGCGHTAKEAPPPSSAPAITNRIPIPAEVVANLGITFEKAKRGRLESRLRVPGRVETAPEARFNVRAPASGRVVAKAKRWDRVTQGQVLADLHSPDLRAAQEEAAEARGAVERADIELLRARAEEGPLQAIASASEEAIATARERIGASESALAMAKEVERAARERVEATAKATAESTLPSSTLFAARKDLVEAQAAALEAGRRLDDARIALPELQLKAGSARSRADTVQRELAALERRTKALDAGFRHRLRAIAAMTGTSAEELARDGPQGPAWLSLEVIPLRSPTAGVVLEVPVSDGEWVEAGATLLRVADPTKVVFRGEVPEGDASRMPADAEVQVEVACAGCPPVATRLEAPLTQADPRTRTVLLELRLPEGGGPYADGASATAAVLLSRSKAEEVLLPTATVVQDELETIVFRRDPAKPDTVIRTPVSVGRRSEGWVEILAEVGEGDEVVRDGVHQLRLTGIGRAPATGHFHADGTWHEGKD
jgi:multidrug efflux pump subunit AcrA (membrane-fusion protein)